MLCAERLSEVVALYVLDFHVQRDRWSVAGREGHNQGVDGLPRVSADPLNKVDRDLGKKPCTPDHQTVPGVCA